MARCQVCGSSDVSLVIDLGMQPICNVLLRDEASFENERFYPLELVRCHRCTLVQLSAVPPANVVFSDGYNYVSGSTPDVVRYFGEWASKLQRRLGLKEGDYVVDIGSNDGTFLAACQNRGLGVLGIEPAPMPHQIALQNGVDSINKPFQETVSSVLDKVGGKLRMVSAFNVVAHTDRPHEFLEGVRLLLENNRGATFVCQSHYLEDMIDRGEWDTIYHEHARYYSLTSLAYLFGLHSLHIYDVERSDFYGGSFIAYASVDSRQESGRVVTMQASERRLGDDSLYEAFAQRIADSRQRLRTLLTELKAEGKRIVGIGAPMKASTLLNYCQIDSRILDYLTEVNPLKINMYFPGIHIKVVAEDMFFRDPPDAAMVLSWNVAPRIMEKLKESGYRGLFIIPIPGVRLIT